MNHTYRKIWSRRLGSYVVVSEATSSRGKSGGTVVGGTVAAAVATAAALLCAGAQAQQAPPTALAANTLPSGASVTAGQARVTSQGNNLAIYQDSSRAAINWQSFSIGSDATVQFYQPNTAAIALNRVVGNERTVIDGALKANGQVWLLNPNGVLFNASARVDVGALVASTRNISDADFMAGGKTLQGTGSEDVINHGQISAADGGFVALIGRAVRNDGTISARLGTVAGAAGDKVTLNFNGDSLVGIAVDQGAFNALVENGGIIRADGGQILLSAKAASSLVDAAVNNTGELRAQTVANQAGRIVLLADMTSGHANVAGTLDASAPAGGNGGAIETSAATVTVGDGAHVTTHAQSGINGNWLIDPTNFSIVAGNGSQTGSSIGAATLATALGSGNVTIQTQSSGSEAGDINVNAGVAWSSNRLTLEAHGSVFVNQTLDGSVAAQLTVNYGQANVAAGNTSRFVVAAGAKVNLPDGNNLVLKQGSDGSSTTYTVISQLGAAGSTSSTDLQGIDGNLSTNFALGADIDASATSGWSSGSGFKPIGLGSSGGFTGSFEGLGHTVSGLSVSRTSSDKVGLFSAIGDGSRIANLRLTSASISGKNYVGAVAGSSGSGGLFDNVAVAGSVFGAADRVGGVVGDSGTSAVQYSASTATVSGTSKVGGLVGYAGGAVRNSSASGQVTGLGSYIGGLVGQAAGTLSYDSATGNVSGFANVGGLAGASEAVSDSTATGDVAGQDGRIGGLVGFANGTISNSSAIRASSGAGYSIFGQAVVGGLVGQTSATGLIVNSTATHSVRVTSNAVGGLVGLSGGTITGSSSHGTVVSANQQAGGLVGVLNAAISDSATDANVTAGAFASGGAVGQASAAIVNVTASGNVSGTSNIGGLVGQTTSAVTASSASGNVVGSSDKIGGLVGTTNSTVTQSVANGSVNGNNQVGGLVGYSTAAISLSQAHGNVTGANDAVGGIVGQSAGGLVSDVQATGNVSGRDAVGGAVGYKTVGNVTNAQATGAVSGRAYIGGAVGNAASGTTISASSASGDVTATGNYAGGLAGLAATLSTSQASGNVSGVAYVGGLAGQSGLTTSVSAAGNVSATGARAGGLIGNLTDALNGGTASGTVQGASQVGGLVGQSSAAISDGHALATATVTGTGSSSNDVGGIVGNGTSVVNSDAANNVSGFSYVGGIAGQVSSVTNSQSSGSVSGGTYVGGIAGTATGALTTVNATGAVSGLGGYVGGVAGSANTASYATATGNVTAGGSNSGGLIGYAAGAVDHSSASGSVTANGTSVAGGLIGEAHGAISDSQASGDVQSGGNVGGLVGYLLAAVSNSSASGNVTGTGGFVGGLVGLGDGGAITGSHASGNVQGSNTVGGLVGIAVQPVSDSYATGNVSSPGDKVGGLIGFAPVPVSNSYATGTVSGANQVGGLVGWNLSSISGSSASGAVTASGDYAGGLVGQGASISGSQASGDVSAGGQSIGGLAGRASSVSASSASGDVTASGASALSVGGLVGLMEGAISASSASGNVLTTGASALNIGGLVGRQEGSTVSGEASGSVTASNSSFYVGGLIGWSRGATVSDSVSTGQVTGRTAVGGLIGNGWGQVNNSRSTGAVSGQALVGGLVGVSTGNLYLDNSYYDVGAVQVTVQSGNASNEVTLGGIYHDLYSTWQNGGYAALNPANYFATNQSGAYQIGSVADARNLLGFIYSGNRTFTLTSNIDVSTLPGWHLPMLVGSLDGAYHTVTNLQNNQPFNDNQGLVGTLEGNIQRLGVTGTVNGRDSSGGLVGRNTSGAISESFALADVTGRLFVGGLVGDHLSGSITDSYSAGTVTGVTILTSHVGGLVGENNASINRSYSSSLVTCVQQNCANYGGLAGLHYGTETNSFAVVSRTGTNTNSWGNAPGEVGLTDAQAIQASTFSAAGWSISTAGGSSSTWRMYEGQSMPLLRGFMEPLTITANTAGTREYDGSNLFSTGVSYSTQPVSSQLTGNLLVSTTSANVGSYTAMPSGLYSGQLGYDISYVGSSAAITPKQLTVTGTTVSGRQYDGSSSVGLSVGTVQGFVGSETLGIAATGTLDSANAGTRAATIAYALADGSNGGLASNYNLPSEVQSVVVTPRVVSLTVAQGATRQYDGTSEANSFFFVVNNVLQADASGVLMTGAGELSGRNAGTQSVIGLGTLVLNDPNYTLTGAPYNGSVVITPRRVNVATVAGATRAYDGTSTIDASQLYVENAVAGDDIGLSGTAPLFGGANVGIHPLFGGSGLTLVNNGNGNYTLVNASSQGAVLITPKQLTVGTQVSPRAYDGTTNAALTIGALQGLVGSETLGITGTGTLDNGNAGTRTAAITYALSNGGNGGLASNYSLPDETQSVVVSPRIVSLTTAPGATRSYDGTSGANAFFFVTNNVLPADAANLVVSGTAELASRNAGNQAVIGLGTLALNDANYTLAGSPFSGSVVVTPLRVNVAAVAGATRAYDGTSTIDASQLYVENAILGDNVGLSGSAPLFGGANVGVHPLFGGSGLTLVNNANGNYTLVNATSQGSVQITPKQLTINGTQVNSRAYDGTTGASLTLGTLNGLVAGESLGVSGTATLSSPNAGARSAQIVYTLANGANGGVAANYSLPAEVLAALVTPRQLTITGSSATNKVYDGNTTAQVSTGSLQGLVGGETLGVSASGAFDTKNAGTRSVLAHYTLSDGSGLASNYALPDLALSASITPRVLQLTFSVSNRAYDGTTAAAASAADNRVAGDQVNVSYNAAFNDANVGIAKPITISQLALSGPDAQNYSPVVSVTPSANISARQVGFSLTSVDPSKTWTANGTTQISASDLPNLIRATWLNALQSEVPGTIVFTLWRNGVQVSEATLPGTYEVRAAFLPAANYAVGPSPSEWPILTIASGGEQKQRDAAQRVSVVAPLLANESRSSELLSSNQLPNVTNVPPSVASSFAQGTELYLFGMPNAKEPSQAVPLTQAAQMLGSRSSGASNGTDVRVPLGRNSLVSLVNGGVKLPEQVDQLLFVVARSNDGEGRNDGETGESRTGKELPSSQSSQGKSTGVDSPR